MKKLEALSISIGILGGIATYLTATIIPVPVWAAFIAWACFFILGGGGHGLVRTIASNLTGILIGSLTLAFISVLGDGPVVAAICVGVGSAAMVQASRVPLLSAIPAIVWGFASTVATTKWTEIPITSASMSNPALLAMGAMILGAGFGYISEVWGDYLSAKSSEGRVSTT